MPQRVYLVTIPQGVAEGMPFDVMVGGQKVTVIRPYGTIPGSRMEVSVDNKKSDNGRTASSQTLERSNNAANQGHWQLFSIVTLWLGFEAAAFVLLILCLSHNPFATLQISSSCRLLNPKTGSVLREGYFNLWQGFGDTPECSTKSGHFCVRWSNNGAWKRFKAVSTGADVYSSMSMMADYKSLCYYSWTMTQGLIVTATVFAFMAVIGQIAAIKSPPVTVCVGFLLIFVFALSLAGISQAAYGSSAAQTESWEDFVHNGGSVAFLLNPDQQLVSNPSTTCTMTSTYADGGAFLVTATVISFIIMALIFISACCGWLVTPYRLSDRRPQSRRRSSHTANTYVDPRERAVV